MRLSLQSLVIIPFVLQVVGITSLIGYLSYRSGQAAVHDLAQQWMEETGERVEDNLDNLFEVIESVTRQNAALIQQEGLDVDNLPAMQAHFASQIQNFPDLSMIGLANAGGDFVSVEKQASNRVVLQHLDASSGTELYRYLADGRGKNPVLHEVQTDYDPHPDSPGDAYYVKIREARIRQWSLMVSLTQGKEQPAVHLFYGLPIYDAEGQLQGTTGTTSSLLNLGGILADLEVGRNGQTFVIDRQGQLVATSTGEVPFQPQARQDLDDNGTVRWRRRAAVESEHAVTRAAVESLLQADTSLQDLTQSQGAQFSLGSASYVARVVPSRSELDWLIVTVIPRSDFMAQIQANSWRTTILCGLALIGSIGSGWWTSRRIVRSLSQLAQATDDFTQRQPVLPLPESRIAEVAALAGAFTQMVQSWQAAARLRQGYIQALEQQVAAKTAMLHEAQRVARVGSWVMELSTETVTWSKELYRIYEADSVAPVPRPDLSIQRIYAEDQAWFERAVASPATNFQSFDADFRIVTQKNHIRYVQAKGQPLYDDHGNVVKMIGTVADISDRKQAELALKQSEERLQQISAASPANIYIIVRRVDGSFYFEHMSRAIETIHGIAVQDILVDANRLLERIHPEDRPGYEAAVTRSMERMEMFQHEWRVTHTSGQIRWLQGRSQPVRRDNGEVAWYGIVIDITEQKRVETALQESEHKFASVFHTSPDPAWIATLVEGRVLNANQRLIDFLGYGADEILGKTCLEINLWYWHEDAEHYRQVLQEHGKINDLETLFQLKSGQVRTVLLSARVEFIDHQACVIGSLKDISDRKTLELALQESETQLADILNSAVAAITRMQVFDDGRWEVRHVSDGCEAISGYTAAELIANQDLWVQCIDPDDWAAIAPQLFADIFAERWGTYEYRLCDRNGNRRWIAQTNRSRWDAAQHCWYVTAVSLDVSDRKRIEQELVQAKEAAESANKAKSAFIANISHELRSPLNAILGFADLLHKDDTLPQPHRDKVGFIHSGGQHLLCIINQVLDAAQLEAQRLQLNIRPVQLNRLLADLHAFFALRATQQGLDFAIQAPGLPDWVDTDEMKLRQVLINLLDNAFKFTPQGSVRLLVEPVQKLTGDQLQLRFQVADTGVGMSAADQALLFKPFSQTQSGAAKQQGTGLGLHISAELVQLMGGELTVQSQPKMGSTFQFDLRLAQAESSSLPASSSAEVVGLAEHSSAYRLLIVDDNAVNRRLLTHVLSVVSMEIREADSGQAAIDCWRTWQPHLIWMDLRMPDMDGLAATRCIRTRAAAQGTGGISTKIVAVSATGTQDIVDQAIAAGCDDFVAKPFKRSEIFAVLQRQLEVRYVYSGPRC